MQIFFIYTIIIYLIICIIKFLNLLDMKKNILPEIVSFTQRQITNIQLTQTHNYAMIFKNSSQTSKSRISKLLSFFNKNNGPCSLKNGSGW